MPQPSAAPGLTPRGGWVGQGFVTRPGGCRRASEAPAADVCRSIRDNGFGWTLKEHGQDFSWL